MIEQVPNKMQRTVVAKPLMFVAVACCLFAGCKKNSLLPIGGAVTYDSKPVTKGSLRFLPADGAGPTAACEIIDGKYSVNVSPGKKRVEIEAYRVVGQRRHGNDPKNPMQDIHEQILPEKYNSQSTLVTEIQSSSRVYDFALTK